MWYAEGVTSPGLLTGLAGVGYGLLRLGFGSRIPSVLLLEPKTGTEHSTGTGPNIIDRGNHDRPAHA